MPKQNNNNNNSKKNPIKVDQIGGNKLALNPKKHTNVGGGGGGDQQEILSKKIFFSKKKKRVNFRPFVKPKSVEAGFHSNFFFEM